MKRHLIVPFVLVLGITSLLIISTVLALSASYVYPYFASTSLKDI